MTEQLDLFTSRATEAGNPPAPTAPATFAAPPRPTPLRPGLPGDPHKRAQNIADAVASAWYRQHGGQHIEIPTGLVAALALIQQKDAHGPELATQILAQSPRNLIAMYRKVWAGHWIQRPDLIERARILHEWLDDEHDDHRLQLVQVVTQTALERGLLSLTGYADPYMRSETDVLSPVITAMRAPGDRQSRGEFHTPAPLADVLAEQTLHDLAAETTPPRAHIHDPSCGSGGLLRSAAQAIRHRGLDPCDFRWSMVDVDPIAAACAAVNAIVWGLGPHVTVACDNSLTNPHAVEDAMEEARAVFEHRDNMIGRAGAIAAVRRAQLLLEKATAAA